MTRPSMTMNYNITIQVNYWGRGWQGGQGCYITSGFFFWWCLYRWCFINFGCKHCFIYNLSFWGVWGGCCRICGSWRRFQGRRVDNIWSLTPQSNLSPGCITCRYDRWYLGLWGSYTNQWRRICFDILSEGGLRLLTRC